MHLSSASATLINHTQSHYLFSETNMIQNSIEKYQNLITGNRKYDEELIENFASKQLKNYTKNSQQKDINMLNIKHVLNNICDLNTQLKNLNMKLKSKITVDDQWNENIKKCKSFEYQIKILLKNINCNDLQYLKKKLKKQNNRKNMRQKTNKDLNIKYNNSANKRNHIVNKIDNWIKEKQCEIENIKEKENLSKDADIILSDVRTKRINAKKFLTSLKKLQYLRKVKVAVARVRGEVTPVEADEVFYNIIVKLMQQWIMLDKEYSLEEKGLKLMIKTDNEQKRINHAKNIFDDWELLLFESKMLHTNYYLKMNLETFIVMRMLWDKFITTAVGSEIPIGWLIPTRTSTAWSKFIKINFT